ncbi:hypothetical protein C9374_005572 [Naegleria lovaniensis]|uniref:Uncharacterized protein n=1 Tax=Naegleria lovaniensis TaxID=51637 RepID=A0AA88KK80_NAELO|nr:uncharacterized protein C9374_005572 [Naegleria lovaniensis]KAG2382370.1 hypothetical protein C9374_005572 [Naegleria lovaniensis]
MSNNPQPPFQPPTGGYGYLNQPGPFLYHHHQAGQGHVAQQQQHPYVIYPQMVQGQIPPVYILGGGASGVQPQVVATQPVQMDQEPSLEERLATTTEQPTTNACQSCPFSRLRSQSCRTSKVCQFVKANKEFTAQIVVFTIIAIMTIITLITFPSVALFLLPKVILGALALVSIHKKKVMALNFFNGALIIDFLYLFIAFMVVASSFSHSRSYGYHFAVSIPWHATIHILELVMIVLSIWLSRKVYRQTHSTQVPAQEQVVPVHVASNEQPQQQQSAYARLQDEQESTPQQQAQNEEVIQRYYPSLNNNTNNNL